MLLLQVNKTWQSTHLNRIVSNVGIEPLLKNPNSDINFDTAFRSVKRLTDTCLQQETSDCEHETHQYLINNELMTLMDCRNLRETGEMEEFPAHDTQADLASRSTLCQCAVTAVMRDLSWLTFLTIHGVFLPWRSHKYSRNMFLVIV